MIIPNAEELYREKNDEFEKLADAVNALYDAGIWTCDRPCNESKLWENLRNAVGRESGTSPQPLK